MNSEMDIRGYKLADETFYDYKDEEETPRGTHHTKEDDEDINNCILKNSNKLILEDKDTAEVARKISKNKLTEVAAIASEKAAEIYGLDIVEKNIQTIKNNETRFVIVSSEDSLNSTIEKNKASLKLILNHSNGSLAKVLNIFSDNNINLTKIQSIPVIETPWKYSFFIDLTFTNINDYTNAVKNVKLCSELFKEFGLYKSEKL